MNQKGFVNILVIILVIVLAGVAGYFFLTRQDMGQDIDTSSWRTYQLAHPLFPHWEIKFPQTFRCPESNAYPCSRTPVPVAGTRIDEESKVILSENGKGATSLTLCSEDFFNDVTPPATYCVSVETSKKWSSSSDFFSYIKSQIENPENVAKGQKQGISILKVNDPIVVNGNTVVKIETRKAEAGTEETIIDRYFIERDSEYFLRISVVKHKLSEAQQRATEIDAIISSFRFVK